MRWYPPSFENIIETVIILQPWVASTLYIPTLRCVNSFNSDRLTKLIRHVKWDFLKGSRRYQISKITWEARADSSLVPYHLQNIMPTCRLDCGERHFEDFNFVVKYYRDNIYDRRDATWAMKTRQDSFNIIDMRCVVSIAYFKRELLLQDKVERELNLPKPHLSVKLITSSKRYLSRYQKNNTFGGFTTARKVHRSLCILKERQNSISDRKSVV